MVSDKFFNNILDEKQKLDEEMNKRLKETERKNKEKVFAGLRKPLVPGKARKGKKLKVSGAQGARGLLSLI